MTTAALLVSVGLGSGAQALTFDEFDRLPEHRQENFIFTVLNFYHYQFTQNGQTISLANCMVELDQRTAPDGTPHLYSAVVRSLDVARLAPGNSATVEGVIREVVDRECAR